MIAGILEWVNTLTPQAANLLGTTAGLVSGSVALVAGALFNAHLNRRRDDRLRARDALTLASALRIEAKMQADAFRDTIESFRNTKGNDAGIPKPTSHVWDNSQDQLGLLSEEAVADLLHANLSLPSWYSGMVVVGGGSIRTLGDQEYIMLPSGRLHWAANITEQMPGKFDKVVASLDRFITETRKKV